MPLSVPWFGYRSESHFFFRLSAWHGLYGGGLCGNYRRRKGLFVRLDFIHDKTNPHQSQFDTKPLIIALSILQSTCVCKFQSPKYEYLRSSLCLGYVSLCHSRTDLQKSCRNRRFANKEVAKMCSQTAYNMPAFKSSILIRRRSVFVFW